MKTKMTAAQKKFPIQQIVSIVLLIILLMICLWLANEIRGLKKDKQQMKTRLDVQNIGFDEMNQAIQFHVSQEFNKHPSIAPKNNMDGVYSFPDSNIRPTTINQPMNQFPQHGTTMVIIEEETQKEETQTPIIQDVTEENVEQSNL
jgi:hypothetical protein